MMPTSSGMRYGVLPGGNAPSDPQGEFTGRNLLYTARAARDGGVGDRTVGATRCRRRSSGRGWRSSNGAQTRPRPHLDDKVLTAWNGLMIAAFARASRMLPVESRGCTAALGVGYLDDARRAAAFIREHLWDAATGTLLRRYRQGDAGVEGYAEDYAYLIFGLLELFQSDGDPGVARVGDRASASSRTRGSGIRWMAAGSARLGAIASVLLRLKEDYDGAEPAASSVSVLNLLVLSHLVRGRQRTSSEIDRTLRLFGGARHRVGRAVPMMLAALSTYHAGCLTARHRWRPGRAQQMQAMMQRGRTSVSAVHGDGACALPQSSQRARASAAVGRRRCEAHGGTATAYVCRDIRMSGADDVAADAAACTTARRVRAASARRAPRDRRCERYRDLTMDIQLDIWLRGTNHATTDVISPVGREPRAWTDEDVAGGARRHAARAGPGEESARD